MGAFYDKNDVFFDVNCGCIYKMNLPHDMKMVVLPSWDPIENIEISAIARRFWVSGYCEKIVIPSSVTDVNSEAFKDSFVKEVVWSSNCYKIPDECFFYSDIETISNINHVNKVERDAFSHSNLKEIVWPSGCNVIPKACFQYSSLARVANVQHISVIEEDAFAKLLYPVYLDLSGTICTIEEYAFYDTNMQNITLPYYCMEEAV